MEAEFSAIKEYFGTDYIGALRHYRDTLLRESDWTQFTDSPLTDSKKTEWKTYRQSLRDLPANSSPTLDSDGNLNMSSVTFPTEPS